MNNNLENENFEIGDGEVLSGEEISSQQIELNETIKQPNKEHKPLARFLTKDAERKQMEEELQEEHKLVTNDMQNENRRKSIKLFTSIFFMAIFLVLVAVCINQLNDRNVNKNNIPQENTISDPTPSPKQEIVIPEINPIESGLADIIEATLPSVVCIKTKYTATDGYTSYEDTADGSGIIMQYNDEELLILTNQHVVENAIELSVVFIDNAEIKATIKSEDVKSDLAFISIKMEDMPKETLDAIKCATIGNSDALRLGEYVLAIGNSMGYGQTVTFGVVSALDRECEDEEGVSRTFIQTDAAINPGNSGGPLLNMRGEVVGINESKMAGYMIDGIGFAIPVTGAKEVIDELMARETKYAVPEEERGFLGVTCTAVTEDTNNIYQIPIGAYIVSISDDGAAKRAGIQPGDIIIEVNGVKIKTQNDLVKEISYYANQDEITIKYMRNIDGTWQEKEVKTTLGSRALEYDAMDE